METLSGPELIAAHRDVDTPFNLAIVREGVNSDLVFRKILRLLPGKRIVALAEHDGEAVLVKTYLGRTAARYAAREKFGVDAIADAGVNTPELLWRGQLREGKGELLAFHYLDDARSLDECWDQTDGENERIAVLNQALTVIGRLHNHGVVQKDLHLANFILSGGQLYTIDGGEVRGGTGSPLSEEEGLKNLGLFFAQFYLRHHYLARRVLPTYEMVRDWSQRSSRADQLEKEIARSRESRKRNFIQKVFRDCTRFSCEPSFWRFRVCERDALTDDEVAALIEDPEKWMSKATILKQGNSATVALNHLSDRSLVIKRYNVKNPWHALRRAFRKSRAWHSWSNAYRLEFYGIPALRPIAMIENRIGPLRGTAYLITDYIDGPDAVTCLDNLKNPQGELEALASILHHLAEAQISHGDLKATNFLMSRDGPVIIDLDAMCEHPDRERFERAFRKDLDRFMQNWRARPNLMDRFDHLLGDLPGRTG